MSLILPVVFSSFLVSYPLFLYTPADWQELRIAREAVLKANPDLLKDSAIRAQRMHDIQHKVDQAILQAYPSVADVVTRIENGPVRSQTPNGPTPIPVSAMPPKSTQ
jgi:hypothetical protein